MTRRAEPRWLVGTVLIVALIGCGRQAAVGADADARGDAAVDAEQDAPPDVPPDAMAGPCAFSADAARFGLNVSAGDATSYLPDAVDLGATWIRVELHHDLGLAHYAQVIDQLHAHGRKVLLLVDYTLTAGKPAWSAGATEWAPYRAAFHTDLIAAADALGAKVDAWEVWNEPDHQLTGGYDPGVPADQFGLLLADSAAVIRARSAGLLVVGGLATKRFDYLHDAIVAAGGALDYDGVGVHTYGPPTWTTAQIRTEIDAVIDGWYAVAQRPLWITEAGAVATPEAEAFAAGYVQTLFDRVATTHADKVVSVLYFSWSDQVGFATERFGLVRTDGTRKPSFAVYAALSPDRPAEVCPGPGLPTAP